MPRKPPTYCPPGRTFGNERARKAALKTEPDRGAGRTQLGACTHRLRYSL